MTHYDKEMFDLAKIAHARIYTIISKLTAEIQAGCGGSLTTLVDHAFALRETSKLCDDIRKEAILLYDLASRVTCMLHVQSGSADNIKTDHCTAIPDMKMSCKIPTLKNNPEEYYALMEWLKVPRDLLGSAEHDSEAIRPHWPGMVELITNLAAQGKSVPPGVDFTTQRPIYKLTIRGRRPIDSQ